MAGRAGESFDVQEAERIALAQVAHARAFYGEDGAGATPLLPILHALQEAFGYIGESIKTEVTIDGDALKGAGFTQNMPQTFDLGTVTAQAALHEILLKYAKERDPLVLIVDEKAKKLILSTKVKAEADKLTPFDTAPKK